MKQALLVVSFGTSHQDTLDKTILPIEEQLAKHFPDHSLYRAFTSEMIISKLRLRDQIEIPNVTQSLEHMKREGFTHIRIQPTHVIAGEEYEKMLAQVAPFQGDFQSIFIGTPLLYQPEDYRMVAQILIDDLPPKQEHHAIIFMGHGSQHHAKSAYPMMEYMLHHLGREDIFVGTVEGFPDLDVLLCEMNKGEKITHVRLQPLMIVAGDHAKNDMAGEEASWKTQLEEKGIFVTCTLKGLGEYPEIRSLFCAHCKGE